MDRGAGRKILTIPNLLSLFRLVLAGAFAAVYLTADSQTDYYKAVGVLVLSGLTDFADGKIARHFHMVSELGKVLDPFADKLTQAVVALCLCSRYGPMKLLFLVLVVKELTQAVVGGLAVKRAGRNEGALLCGKVTTFYLYAMMCFLLLVPEAPMAVDYVLILIGVGLLIWSFGTYLVTFRGMLREAKGH